MPVVAPQANWYLAKGDGGGGLGVGGGVVGGGVEPVTVDVQIISLSKEHPEPLVQSALTSVGNMRK